jgi:hypothetical protein
MSQDCRFEMENEMNKMNNPNKIVSICRIVPNVKAPLPSQWYLMIIPNFIIYINMLYNIPTNNTISKSCCLISGHRSIIYSEE